jgi:hypothetical protein
MIEVSVILTFPPTIKLLSENVKEQCHVLSKVVFAFSEETD